MAMTVNMGIYVVIAEASTGKVLRRDGGWYREGDPDYRLRFDDVDAARAFSERYLTEHPDVECLLLDDAGTVVGFLR